MTIQKHIALTLTITILIVETALLCEKLVKADVPRTREQKVEIAMLLLFILVTASTFINKMSEVFL